MSEIKAGLWKEVGSNEYIQVYGLDKHGMVICSEEGSQRKYSLSKSDLLESYELKYLDKKNIDKSTSKTLAGLGMRTLDEYVDSLPAHDSKPIIDDTFNDDTPAQTFSDIKWDEGTNEKSELVVVVPCPSCDRAVPYDRHGALFLVGKMAVCSDCYAKNGREGGLAGKKYMTRVPNLWRRDEKKVEAATDDITLQDFMDVMVDRMRLIGIAGPARAGKDTLASYLLDNLSDDWSRSSFADPLKAMLSVIGVDCSDDAKAVIDDSYGVTPRHMMQTLGTEWGRHMIDGDIWVKAFARLNVGKCVIVPDVRFEDEAALVREHGVLIHLVGRGGIEGNHVSENAIEFKPGDIVIDNSRDLAWLHGQVDGNAVLGEFIAEVGE